MKSSNAELKIQIRKSETIINTKIFMVLELTFINKDRKCSDWTEIFNYSTEHDVKHFNLK